MSRPLHSPSTAPQVARNLWVENAKAIGIVLVVYGHVTRGAWAAGLIRDTPRFELVDSLIYCFHMPLFFFLSGLFFYSSLRKRGPAGLIVNKLDTLFYTYVVWSLLQGSIEATFSRWTNVPVSFTQVLEFLWEPKAQLWFLYALFLIFAVAALLYARTPHRWFGWISVAAMFGFIFRDHDLGNHQLVYLLTFFCFFALGVQFNEWQRFVFERRWQWLIPTLVLFAVSEYIFHFTLGLTYRSIGLPSLLIALVSIAFVITLSMCLTDRQSRLLALIGSSSLIIYLLHILLASGSRVLLTKVFGINDIYTIVTVGCACGVILPLLFAIDRFRRPVEFLFSIPPGISLERRIRDRESKRSDLVGEQR
jgi:fucose 4-O-acetylase-like acetyltransferase